MATAAIEAKAWQSSMSCCSKVTPSSLPSKVCLLRHCRQPSTSCVCSEVMGVSQVGVGVRVRVLVRVLVRVRVRVRVRVG